jgi:hypothetical protein
VYTTGRRGGFIGTGCLFGLFQTKAPLARIAIPVASTIRPPPVLVASAARARRSRRQKGRTNARITHDTFQKFIARVE